MKTPLSPEVAAEERRRLEAVQVHRQIAGLLRLARAQGYEVMQDPDRKGIIVHWVVRRQRGGGRSAEELRRVQGGDEIPSSVVHLMDREEEVYDHLAALKELRGAVFQDDLRGPAAAGGDPAGTPGGNNKEGAPATAPGSTGPVAARAPSINNTEGVSAPTRGTARPEPRDRAPSIPYHTAECLVGMEPCPPRPVALEGTPSTIFARLTAARVVTGVSFSVMGEAGFRNIPLKEPLEVQAGQTVVVGPDGAGGYKASLCPACDPGRPCLDHGGVEQVPPPMPRWMRATCWALVAGLLAWVGALLLVAPPEVTR